MRVGIVTQPLATNYGGILQNFALQTVLKRMGNEVWTLDIYKYTWSDYLLYLGISLVKKILGKKCKFPKTPIRRAHEETPLRKFVHKNISLTTPRTKFFDKTIVEKYDLEAVVVGSDQVWRPLYNGKIEDSFLDFIDGKDIIRIAYAASFGSSNWEYTLEQEQKCSELLKKFNVVTVREDSGVTLCNQYFKVDAKHVLDPTLLLDSHDYSLLCDYIDIKAPFVFAYLLDATDAIKNEIKSFAESKGLPYLIVSAGNHIKSTDSVESWLANFRDASYVITDSFHGTVFSIIFKKDFYVLGNEDRGNDRFNSLLNCLDLKDRMINGKINSKSMIDWTMVYKNLDIHRKMSLLQLQLLKQK